MRLRIFIPVEIQFTQGKLYKADKQSLSSFSLCISRKQTFSLVFTMSAPSTTASQTEFCNAMSSVRVTSEPASGYDTPMPENRISEETLRTLNAVKEQLELPMSNRNKPQKRKRVNSPNQSGPSAKKDYTDLRDNYPAATKPIYLRLKNLHRKKLSLASTIKVMEGRLAKNQYPTSVDFKFNINSTRSPKLKDHWSRIIRRCKSELTTTLIDDLQAAYSRTKASIAKDLTELDTLLTKEQSQEIKDSLLDKFQQMAPIQIDKTQKQFADKQPKKRFNQAPRRRQNQAPNQRRQRNDPKMDKLLSTLKALLK